MASNPYVNKVVYGNQTLIDITDTTAVASDVAIGKYFYTAAGARTVGTYKPTGVLPQEYQLVEYLAAANAGGQYINTGYYISNDTVLYIEYAFPSGVSARAWHKLLSVNNLLQVQRSNTNSYLQVAVWDASASTWRYNWSQLTNSAAAGQHRLKIDLGTSRVKGDVGTTVSTGYDSVTLSANVPLTIFSQFDGTESGSTTEAYVRDLAIYESGELVKHFVPCYRKADSVRGMYETVEGEFYTNAGTGSFNVGDDV